MQTNVSQKIVKSAPKNVQSRVEDLLTFACLPIILWAVIFFKKKKTPPPPPPKKVPGKGASEKPILKKERSIQQVAHERVLTAEGWRRQMLKELKKA